MNRLQWEALVYLADNDGYEVDLANRAAQGQMMLLGKLADQKLVDVRPGKKSPAYWINRRGLEKIGATIQ